MDKTNKNPNVPNLRFPLFIDNWKLQSINSLLSFKNGINADANKYGKGIKYISVGDILNNVYINYENIKGLVNIDESILNNYSVTYGDILFQRSSETPEDIGRTNVYLDNDKVATFGGFVIRGKKIGVYNPLFFHYLLKSPSSRKSIMRLGAGAQHYNIGQESLRCLSFYFPQLFEQEKIANLLFKIDARIQTQIKIIEAYSSLMNSICVQLISKKDENTTIEQCLNCNCSTIKESDLNETDYGNYPVYGANGYIRSICTYQEDKTSIGIIKDGAGVGKIQKLKGKYSILGTMNYLTAKDHYNIDYLFYALKTKSLKKYVVGSGIPHIYFRDYKLEKLYIPNDATKINKIVALLDSINDYIGIEKEHLDRLNKTKKYLLKNMFC